MRRGGAEKPLLPGDKPAQKTNRLAMAMTIVVGVTAAFVLIITGIAAATLYRVNHPKVEQYRSTRACYSTDEGPIPIAVVDEDIIYSEPIAFNAVRKSDDGFNRNNGKYRVQGKTTYESMTVRLTLGLEANSLVTAHLFHVRDGDDRVSVVDFASASTPGSGTEVRSVELALDPRLVDLDGGDLVYASVQQTKIDPALPYGNRSFLAVAWDCDANVFWVRYR